ncbi:hypothetical protein PV381_36465, partial [Streptomyces scabiei]|nr:hypothetical protein [Streptomyces scabiei]
MDGRDLVRSVKAIGSAGVAEGLRAARAAWRGRRADAAALPARGAERARVPGAVVGAEPGPGGGVVRFGRSALRVTVDVNGAVFWGWDGAGPEPSYALAGRCPEPDPRVVLEPDKDGGWRVVAERVTVVVSRLGAVEVCTPGGVTVLLSPPTAPTPLKVEHMGVPLTVKKKKERKRRGEKRRREKEEEKKKNKRREEGRETKKKKK